MEFVAKTSESDRYLLELAAKQRTSGAAQIFVT